MSNQYLINDIIYDNFSKEQIEIANASTEKYLKQKFKAIFVQKTSNKKVFFSELYDRLKSVNGIQNPCIDYIFKSNKSVETIQSVVISFLIHTGESIIPGEYFQNDLQKLLESDLAELKRINFTSLPEYIEEALRSMIYMFGVEFDDCFGWVKKGDYKRKRRLYTSLEKYGEFKGMVSYLK